MKGEVTCVGVKYGFFVAMNDLASAREGLGCHLESILCSCSITVYFEWKGIENASICFSETDGFIAQSSIAALHWE